MTASTKNKEQKLIINTLWTPLEKDCSKMLKKSLKLPVEIPTECWGIYQMLRYLPNVEVSTEFVITWSCRHGSHKVTDLDPTQASFSASNLKTSAQSEYHISW